MSGLEIFRHRPNAGFWKRTLLPHARAAASSAFGVAKLYLNSVLRGTSSIKKQQRLALTLFLLHGAYDVLTLRVSQDSLEKFTKFSHNEGVFKEFIMPHIKKGFLF